MKYIVEVNAKYLVSLEASSCLDAEHKLLDYNGVWGALAFDQKMTKTDTFLGAVQGCEMTSLAEIQRMADELTFAAKVRRMAAEVLLEKQKEVEELEAALAKAKQNRDIAEADLDEATRKHEKAEEQFGKQRT